MSKCCISGGALDFFDQSVVGSFFYLTSSGYEKGRVWTLFLTAYIPFFVESITVCAWH